jgi:hypothetical protein
VLRKLSRRAVLALAVALFAGAAISPSGHASDSLETLLFRVEGTT